MEKPSLLIIQEEQESNKRTIVCEFAPTAVITLVMTAMRFFQLLIDYTKRISTCLNLICGKKGGLPSPRVIFFLIIVTSSKHFVFL